MRYVITGAQGTGKSSVLAAIDNNHSGQINVITEVVRNLSKKEGIAVNEKGNENGQTRIFGAYVDLLSHTKTPFISDRGLTDVIAYTCYNMKNKGEKGEKFLDEQIDKFVEYQKNYPDTVYFYVPIEFDVVYDGFRSMDEEFRKEIDKNIKDLLDAMNVDYITLTGTVEERVATVEGVMRNYGDIQ